MNSSLTFRCKTLAKPPSEIKPRSNATCILPTFQRAATAAYGLQGKASAPTLNIGINSAPAAVLKTKPDAK